MSNTPDVHAGTTASTTNAPDVSLGAGTSATTPSVITTPSTGTGVDAPGSYVSGALNQNNAGEGYAAANNYEGDAFRASAGIGQNPDTNIHDTRDTNSGTTAVGAVNEDADVAPMGGASTPGVRAGFDDSNAPGFEAGGVNPTGADTPSLGQAADDAISGNRVDDTTSGIVLNDPANNVDTNASNATTINNEGSNNIVNAAHNAGSSTEGAVHGVIGDVTHPNRGNDTSGV